MDSPLRFLHASDFHLERPPRGLAELPDHLRGALGDAPYRAAERVFAAAVKHRVDFLALAGDIVDPLAAGPRALVFLNEQFQKLADEQIVVYWAGGPHDQLDHWIDAWPLPENVIRFPLHRVERLVHDRHGQAVAQILGTSSSHLRRVPAGDFVVDRGDVFVVAIAHGTAETETMCHRGVHYWALGSDHERHSLAGGPTTIHYCGTPQGRSPQDLGARGCTLVEVHAADRVRTSFIPTDAVRYCEVRLHVDEATSREQLYQQLSARLGELLVDPFGPELLVHCYVSGSRALAAHLRLSNTATELVARLRNEHGQKRPAAWTLAVEATSAEGLPLTLYDEESLLGEFLRTMRHYGEHLEDPLSLEAFLHERHRAGEVGELAMLNEPGLRGRVLAEAAALGVELLGQREERR